MFPEQRKRSSLETIWLRRVDQMFGEGWDDGYRSDMGEPEPDSSDRKEPSGAPAGKRCSQIEAPRGFHGVTWTGRGGQGGGQGAGTSHRHSDSLPPERWGMSPHSCIRADPVTALTPGTQQKVQASSASGSSAATL